MGKILEKSNERNSTSTMRTEIPPRFAGLLSVCMFSLSPCFASSQISVTSEVLQTGPSGAQSQRSRTPQRSEGIDVNVQVHVERSMTPDSYDMATKVGQSIAAAFLKLGSHSQEIALSSSAKLGQ